MAVAKRRQYKPSVRIATGKPAKRDMVKAEQVNCPTCGGPGKNSRCGLCGGTGRTAAIK